MASRIGIIADDLTGAGDTAVQFVRAGWTTELQLTSRSSRAAVIAVTTDSRNLAPSEAADTVVRAVRHLRDSGVTHIYKKIDSTLRGAVAAEINAALEAWSPRAVAVVCPAFPASGRTVCKGELLVNGVAVSKTSLAGDPVTPVKVSHIPTLLGTTAVVVANEGESPEDLAERLLRSGRIVVVDATTDDDLHVLAQSLALLDSAAIPVGSAGLARHLAETWRPAPHLAPAIVIVTSQQEVARQQAAAVESTGAFRYEPTPDELEDDRAWARASAKILDQLDESHSTLLLTATGDRTRNLPASLIPTRLAELASRAITQRASGSVCGLVVTGGDGARALVDALGATGIALRDEVVSGIPLGTLVGGIADGMPIVTKAGGFGKEDALVRSIQAVRDGRSA